LSFAYLLGMAVAFTQFRTLVFGRSGASVATEIYRFIIVNLVALTLVWAINMGLADSLAGTERISPISSAAASLQLRYSDSESGRKNRLPEEGDAILLGA
jgi:hypothetical protein